MQALLLLSEGTEGPNTELLWILAILLGFFALAVVSGWLSVLLKPNQAETLKEASHSHHAEEDVENKKPADESLKSGKKKK